MTFVSLLLAAFDSTASKRVEFGAAVGAIESSSGSAAVRATGFRRAAAGQTQTITSKHPIAQIESAADAWQSGWGDKPTKADGRVESPENLDSFDPFAGGKASVNAGHQIGVRFAERQGVEIIGGDIGKPHFVLSIALSQPIDFPSAKRAIAIEENLNFPIFRDVIADIS
jgi:hypothetical protein